MHLYSVHAFRVWNTRSKFHALNEPKKSTQRTQSSSMSGSSYLDRDAEKIFSSSFSYIIILFFFFLYYGEERYFWSCVKYTTNVMVPPSYKRKEERDPEGRVYTHKHTQTSGYHWEGRYRRMQGPRKYSNSRGGKWIRLYFCAEYFNWIDEKVEIERALENNLISMVMTTGRWSMEKVFELWKPCLGWRYGVN